MDEPAAETNGNGYTAAEAYPGFRPPEPVELPSGATFLLRKPQIMKMARKGQLPNPLMEIINRTFEERDQRDLQAEAERKGVTIEQLQEEHAEEARQEEQDHPPVPPDITATEGLEFRDVMVFAAVVKPEISFDPPASPDVSPLTGDGKLSYDAISDNDLNFIVHWCNLEMEEVATFPGERVGRESPGGDSGTVRPEAERPALDPA